MGQAHRPAIQIGDEAVELTICVRKKARKCGGIDLGRHGGSAQHEAQHHPSAELARILADSRYRYSTLKVCLEDAHTPAKTKPWASGGAEPPENENVGVPRHITGISHGTI